MDDSYAREAVSLEEEIESISGHPRGTTAAAQQHVPQPPDSVHNAAELIEGPRSMITRREIAPRPAGILRLSRHYGDERLEAACKRALVAGARSFRHVDSILQLGLDRLAPAARLCCRTHAREADREPVPTPGPFRIASHGPLPRALRGRKPLSSSPSNSPKHP